MNAKNLFLTAIITIATSCPAFATGSGIGASAQSADCDNGTLGTYQGESTLSAQWTANTIKLDFYDGDDKISSGTCTYDGGIELPNDPEKTGYEFSGWKVRRAAAPAPSGPNCSAIIGEAACNTTESCAYEYFSGKCVNKIYVTTLSYSSCQEITDPEECGSIFTRAGYEDYDTNLCVWDSRYGRCDLSYGGRFTENYYLPEAQKSWCYSASNPYDCQWYVDDNGTEICQCND